MVGKRDGGRPTGIPGHSKRPAQHAGLTLLIAYLGFRIDRTMTGGPPTLRLAPLGAPGFLLDVWQLGNFIVLTFISIKSHLYISEAPSLYYIILLKFSSQSWSPGHGGRRQGASKGWSTWDLLLVRGGLMGEGHGDMHPGAPSRHSVRQGQRRKHHHHKRQPLEKSCFTAQLFKQLPYYIETISERFYLVHVAPWIVRFWWQCSRKTIFVY